MRLKAVQKVVVVEKIFGRKLEAVGVTLDKIDATKTTEIKKKLKAKEKSELSKAFKKIQKLNEHKQKLTIELKSVKKQLNESKITNEEQRSILQTSNDELVDTIDGLMKEKEQMRIELESVRKELIEIKTKNKEQVTQHAISQTSNEELTKENKQNKELWKENMELANENIQLKKLTIELEYVKKELNQTKTKSEQQRKSLKDFEAQSQKLTEELKLSEQESIALIKKEYENEIGLLNEEINKLKDKGSVFQISNLEEVNIDEHVLTEARSASNVTFVDNLFLFLKYNKVTKENVNELDKYFNVNEYDSETITEDVLDEEQ
eukprot:297438_1